MTQGAAPRISPRDWGILCDFDGTITPFDVTDAILERFADPQWETIENEWLRGSISARQCMEAQIRLIRAEPADLDEFLATIPLTPGFLEFVDFCRVRGLDLMVVSDGMDYAIKRVLAWHGLGGLPVIANRLLYRDDSGFRLDFPYGVEGCRSGVCKCEVARGEGRSVLLIGDSHSDCCLAGMASFVLARRDMPLEAHCRKNLLPHVTYGDFFDVRTAVETMLETAPGSGSRPAKPGMVVTPPQIRP